MGRLIIAAFAISIFAGGAAAENAKPSCGGYCANHCQSAQGRSTCIQKCVAACERNRAGS